MATLVGIAYKKALEILRSCLTDKGFRAGAYAEGYPQIWSRDNGIIAFGALATDCVDLHDGVRAALSTMRAHQSERGRIQLNVLPDTGEVSTENAGAVDGNLWYVITHAAHWQKHRDLEFLRASWDSICAALRWVEYQDMNEDGLIEIPEAGNWMDLFAVRYNTLYDNVLYALALRAFSMLAQEAGEQANTYKTAYSAGDVAERINTLFWIDRCWHANHFAEHLERLQSMRLEWFMLYHNIGEISKRPFYLPWVGFREYGDFFDGLGNILAVLTGVADNNRAHAIATYMRQVHLSHPFPTKAIYPAVRPGDPFWREYYRSRNLNLPDQYHNGGIWPMIGGFAVALYVHIGEYKHAQTLLCSLAHANKKGIQGEWEFNEWMHGVTGEPMGFPRQAWSASSFLFATHCEGRRRVPFFGEW